MRVRTAPRVVGAGASGFGRVCIWRHAPDSRVPPDAHSPYTLSPPPLLKERCPSVASPPTGLFIGYRTPLPLDTAHQDDAPVKSAVLASPLRAPRGGLWVPWLARSPPHSFLYVHALVFFSPFGLRVGAPCRASVKPSSRLPRPRRPGPRSSPSATLRPGRGRPGFAFGSGEWLSGGAPPSLSLGLRAPPPFFLSLGRYAPSGCFGDFSGGGLQN